jgi:GTP-binding protein
LIEGAHEGAGLGDRFLGHVERCRVLLHLVDGTSEDPGQAYEVIRGELEAYGHGLAEKPEIVALSKADALDEQTRAERARQLEAAAGRKPLILSSASGEGVQEVLHRLLDVIDGEKASERAQEPAPAWQP